MEKIKDWLKTFFQSGKLIILILIFNFVILLLHLFRIKFVLIDNTTIFLMILVLMTPFASHIKKIKFGDFEAELAQDIKELEKNAKDIGVEKDIEFEKVESVTSVRTETIAKELRDLAEKDRFLAFAKLRMEIEFRLKRLFVYVEEGNMYGIRSMTQTLTATGVINNKLRNLILDIIFILNKVVHGEDIPTEANVDRVLRVGIEILSELDFIFYDKLIEPSSKKKITKKELEGYMTGKYQVISVIPLAKESYINKRILDQEQLDQFLEGYNEYAEFLVSIKKV